MADPAEGGAEGEGGPRSPWLVVLVVAGISVGLGLRVAVWRSGIAGLDFDEAVVGLQARAMLHGHFSAFFWGQPYGGTLETGVVAVAMRLFGSSRLVLQVVPATLHGLACVIVWRVGLRVTGRTRAALAGLILWCAPGVFVWWSLKERGFYGVALVLAALVLLLVLRLADHAAAAKDVAGPNPSTSPNDLLALGLVLGLGVWTSPLVALVAVPAVLWLLVTTPAVRRQSWMALPTLLLGAAPWLIWNARHNMGSLTTGNGLRTTAVDRWHYLFGRVPVVTGLQVPFGRQLLLPGGWLVTTVVLIGGFALCLARARSDRRVFLGVVVVGYVALFAANPVATGAGPDPRYLYLLAPVVALLVAGALPRNLAAGFATLAVVVALAVWGLAVMPRAATADQYRAGGSLDQVLRSLQAHGDRAVFTETVGSTLMFLADDRSPALVASCFAIPRDAAAEQAVRAAPLPVYVLDRESIFHNDLRLEAALTGTHQAFTVETYGRWALIRPARRVWPEEVPLYNFLGPAHAPARSGVPA